MLSQLRIYGRLVPGTRRHGLGGAVHLWFRGGRGARFPRRDMEGHHDGRRVRLPRRRLLRRVHAE